MTITHTGNSIITPFTILVDHRERGAAYHFTQIPCGKQHAGRVWQVPTEVCYVKTGDYTIRGLEQTVAIERKSLPDLYSTLGQHRDRFRAEIERLAELDFAAVVIEADLREVWRPAEFHPNWRSKLHPRSVEGTIVSWSMRYPRVHWWFCGSRRAGEVRTFLTLAGFWKQKEYERKQAENTTE